MPPKSQENCSNNQKSPLLSTPKKQDPLREISTETFHVNQRKAPQHKQIFQSLQSSRINNEFKDFFICKNKI